MTRLDEFASNTYSQFGEDGIIEHIFDVIEPVCRFAVEFGAGDGLSCSNTARLWRDDDWRAFLVEPDPGRYDELQANLHGTEATSHRAFITPTGPTSITELLQERALPDPDLMSIDVDGDDYEILKALTCHPRVISIEFNPTVPPHLAVRQRAVGETFGASLLSIIRLAAKQRYTFIGATRCNAFLVRSDEAAPFHNYERDPTVLFAPGEYTYAVTDFSGQIMLCGQALPWGAKLPYVLPLEASTYVTPATNDPQHIRRGFEQRWGPAMWLTAHDLDRETLLSLLINEQPPLVCLDLTNGTLSPTDWMSVGAEARNYRALLVGPVIGLVKEQS